MSLRLSGVSSSLGYSSAQVPQNFVHTRHLQASLTSTHRPSEPFLHIRGTIPRPSESKLNVLFLFLNHPTWRKSYLDSITRLIPTVKVSVLQHVHPKSSSHDSTERELHPAPHAAPYLLHGSGVRGSPPPIKDKLTCIQPRPNRCPLLPEHHLRPEHPGSTVSH